MKTTARKILCAMLAAAFGLGINVTGLASNDDDIEEAPDVTIPITKEHDDLQSLVILDEAIDNDSIFQENTVTSGSALTIDILDNDPITDMNEKLIDEFTIQTLSLAMTFYMYGRDSLDWELAYKYDLNGDGMIDLLDFIIIANTILDVEVNI